MALVPFLLAATMAAAPIDAARWHARILLVFAPSTETPALAAQRAIDSREMKLRDLRRVEVVADRVSGATDPATALRRRFRIGPGEFRVVLLGKDAVSNSTRGNRSMPPACSPRSTRCRCAARKPNSRTLPARETTDV